MAIQLLINSEKYSGKYVATRSFKDKKVVTYGQNPIVVLKRAVKKGAANPVVFYIPPKNMVHIY